MANSAQPSYTANLGTVTISTANSNLDGTGALGVVITGTSSGTLVKSLIIKSQTNTSLGMVRFFAKKTGGHDNLLSEINVQPIIKSSRDASYSAIVPLNYTLESGEVLSVSTQNGDTFNVFAEAFDISYIASTNFLGSSSEFVAAAGSDTVSVANSNLNGSGTLTKIFAAGAATSFSGCAIRSITIKAQQTTSPGMVRLFLKPVGASAAILFCEITIPSVVQSATTQSFMYEVIKEGNLCIPASCELWAATEKSETFSVVVEGSNWNYV